MTEADEIRAFWIDEVGPAGWYKQDEALDQSIRDRFLDAWEAARGGNGSGWMTGPQGALAYLILLDQFPRNMFRGDARSFATDAQARAAAKKAITLGWDLRVPVPGRQFFYLPLMHSESLPDQDRSVRLLLGRMGEGGRENILHARAHREVIRRFGRFPYRNDVLGRTSTRGERAFMEAGGYGALVREMGERDAAARR